jgi:hypothetical protein
MVTSIDEFGFVSTPQQRYIRLGKRVSTNPFRLSVFRTLPPPVYPPHFLSTSSLTWEPS